MKLRKKLIEVALPLDAINAASAREKSIRHGHPSTLHLWWARRPLAAARAVIFSQMVDDPSAHPELFPTEEAQEKERQRLFRIIEELVKWENTTNEIVLNQAREEIWKSWRTTCADNRDNPRAAELFNPDKLPAFHDPFAGGGALPLEAQRLGLVAYASDLNPVAVLINKAMIEIPPKFAGRPPVNPEAKKEKGLFDKTWKGAQGLAEDVRYYGKWMRDEAKKRIGHLYPKIEVTEEMAAERTDLKPYVGRQLTVIAWLWARTVKSPNPAFKHIDVPLVSTYILSKKIGHEANVKPIINKNGYQFTVQTGKPKDIKMVQAGTKLSRGANFMCVMSGTPISSSHIYDEANAGRMGVRLMAIVALGDQGRLYLSPESSHEAITCGVKSEWKPEVAMPENPRWFSPPLYGLKTYGDLFTPRQLATLSIFTDLVGEAYELILKDAVAEGLPTEGKQKYQNQNGAKVYTHAICCYLAIVVSRMTDYSCTITTWANNPQMEIARNAFARQAIQMTWDFAETNTFGPSSGSFDILLEWVAKVLDRIQGYTFSCAVQADAGAQVISHDKIVSTDPPYYDNIGYADLSDFFYVWLRRSLKSIFPDLFATITVPKADELVATPYRHGSRQKAESFFLKGMTKAMHRLAETVHPAYPVTIYYAFKQSESKNEAGTSSTGWETFLDAVRIAGFAICGTWPIRTERAGRTIGIGANALASSIVLVCRKRPTVAPVATRREFFSVLKSELPVALAYLQRGNIAPVDLSQAAIGPGMAIFTRYSKVLDAAGNPMMVREALALINQTLDEALAAQEGDFDADSRWAIAWFEQQGFAEGDYGAAETLSTAKNTSVSGMVAAGILLSKSGKVRLLRPDELPADWDPAIDKRLTVWEIVHHLIRALESGGEPAAADLVVKLGVDAENARELAYRLYTLCERKKRATEALSYNALVQSWPEISRLAQEAAKKMRTPFTERNLPGQE